jgi:hypothetical protein
VIKNNPFDKITVPFSFDFASDNEEFASRLGELVDLKRRILSSNAESEIDTVELYPNRISKRMLGILRVLSKVIQIYLLSKQDLKENKELSSWMYRDFEEKKVSDAQEKVVLSLLEIFLKGSNKLSQQDVQAAYIKSNTIGALLEEELKVTENNLHFIQKEKKALQA